MPEPQRNAMPFAGPPVLLVPGPHGGRWAWRQIADGPRAAGVSASRAPVRPPETAWTSSLSPNAGLGCDVFI